MAGTHARLPGLVAAANDIEGDTNDGNPSSQLAVTSLSVKAMDTLTPIVADKYKIEQIGYILKQLQFPNLQHLRLDVGSVTTLHTSASAPQWGSLTAALQGCSFSELKTVRLDIGDMWMNGQAISVDFCVSP
jgi:hypothetical protein